ncbi:hypothetical protein HMPREF9019_1840 [Hoylesella timonensis CRIS 5C-B1]|uniref:Uncharacterized protein n=1 Tax=Hoylesella timonensis CRIS 5C-B1 TaxID=679189 RepID=D1VZJ1_9BACT|nr:hypothetical protein HMPREF9019_1840 [Hoylesella timonensis CRIS 5C-B1]
MNKNAFSLEEKYRKMDALVHATDKGKVGNLSQTIRSVVKPSCIPLSPHAHNFISL